MHYFYISVQRKFTDGEYSKISEFVMDVRCLLLNCYTYFGPNDIHTQKALKVEQVLKEKLALLPVWVLTFLLHEIKLWDHVAVLFDLL